MASCPGCGSKSGGFFRLCGICKMENDMLTKPKVVVDETNKEND